MPKQTNNTEDSAERLTGEPTMDLQQQFREELTHTDTMTESQLTQMAEQIVNLERTIAILASRVELLETRLLCSCDAWKTSSSVHMQWCTLYEPPAKRYRDCFNCGNTGFVSTNNPLNPTEFTVCNICNGSGKVVEQWLDGQLVWQSDPSNSTN